MTKDMYFEMCEALGGEPIEEEIPVEYEDLIIEVQEALSFYDKLRDEYNYADGSYVGKNYSGLADILEIVGIHGEDRKTVFELIGVIDRQRKAAIEESKPKKDPIKPAQIQQ